MRKELRKEMVGNQGKPTFPSEFMEMVELSKTR